MAEFKGVNVTGRFADNRSLDVNSAHCGAPLRTAQDRVTADFAQDDTIHMVDLPSRAVLVFECSRYATTALGASVTMAIGFADDARPAVKSASSNGAGIASKTAALLAATSVASAGGGSAVGALAITDRGKRLWEIAGLARDPGCDLKVIATLGGANPNSGTVAWEIAYTIDG